MPIKLLAFGCSLVLALCLATPAGWAASSGSSDSSSASTAPSSDYGKGKKAADDGDYETALGLLHKAAGADPTNADAYNMLGFSYRKLGNVEKAFENYNAALAIKADHIGANEYIGELYLELGDLANAEKHLKVLDEACFFGCEAYTDLQTAIKNYKAKQGG